MKPSMSKTFRFLAIAVVCAGAFGLIAMAQQKQRGREAARAAGPYDVSPLETEVLGQSRWLRGGPAALRVIVTDHLTGKPVNAQVRIGLASVDASGKPAAEAASLFSGRTNGVGSVDAQFAAPSSTPGPYELRVS